MGHLPYRDELGTSKHDASPSHQRSAMEQHVWATTVKRLCWSRYQLGVEITPSSATVLNDHQGTPAIVLTQDEWLGVNAANRAEFKALGFTVEGE